MTWNARVQLLKDRSATFNSLFGVDTVRPGDIINIIAELCPSGWDERVIISRIGLPRINPLKSVIATYFTSGGTRNIRRVYRIIINDRYPINGPAWWFLLGHELGHFCFHKRWLEYCNFRQIASNIFLEEEADFFSRLLLWPMCKITDELAATVDTNSRATIIDYLVAYQRQQGVQSANDAKLSRIACNFLVTYERVFPDQYKSFIARVLPPI